MNKRTTAFTISEILMVLMIIGLIAAMTIPSLVRNTNDTKTVSGVKKTYSALSEATKRWQIDEGCIGDVSVCLNTYASTGTLKTKEAFAGVAKYLKVAKQFCGVDQSPAGVDWLPETTMLLNGWRQSYAWEGVSQALGYHENSCYYLLDDGTTLRLEFPDNLGVSAFGLFDVNGKAPPNRVGKDTFPIGWGAASNAGWATKSVNPYWAEDQWANSATKPDGTACTDEDWIKQTKGCAVTWITGPEYKGLCRISCLGCTCKPDVHSPTAYVIQYGELPDLKAAGYP